MHIARLLTVVGERVYTPLSHPSGDTHTHTHPPVTHPMSHCILEYTPLPHCMLGYPVTIMTDRCKNISLPQTVKNLINTC